jgi:hypothetical protein
MRVLWQCKVEVMFINIQRENIRPSKKEVNNAVTMLDVCSYTVTHYVSLSLTNRKSSTCMPFHEIWYRHYAIWGYSKLILSNFLQPVIPMWWMLKVYRFEDAPMPWCHQQMIICDDRWCLCLWCHLSVVVGTICAAIYQWWHELFDVELMVSCSVVL